MIVDAYEGLIGIREVGKAKDVPSPLLKAKGLKPTGEL